MLHSEPTANLPTLLELRTLLVDGHGTLAPRSTLYDVMSHPLAFVAGEAQALVTVHHSDILRILESYVDLGSQPVMRVQRTRQLMAQIEFGTSEEAELASRRLWDIHSGLVATRADGSTVSATDPESLAVLMIMGQMCTATWNTLMTTPATGSHLTERADDLFARMWTDHQASRASIGIPAGYLPTDPRDATAWLTETLERRWADGPRATELASRVLALPRGYVQSRYPLPVAMMLRLPAAALAHAATAAAVLSLRGALVARAQCIASPRSVSLGLHAARTIRLALRALPDAAIHRIVETPPEAGRVVSLTVSP